MAQTTFTDNVVVQGTRDVSQLEVQGIATQTAPLQKWKTNAGIVKAQVTAEGRLQVGDNLTAGTVSDALMQANGDITLPSSQIASGLHTIGKVQGPLSNSVTWAVHELQLAGTGSVSGVHTTSRHKLNYTSTGDPTNADLRTTETQATNEKGTSAQRLGNLTGLRAILTNAANAFLGRGSAVQAIVTNDAGGNINTAYGIEVLAPINDATGAIGQLSGIRVADMSAVAGTVNNYTALSIDNDMELKLQSAAPVKTPAAGVIKVYPKLSGGVPKLYAKTQGGIEYELSGGISSVGLTMPTEFAVANSPLTSNGTLAVTKATQVANIVYAGPASGGAAQPTFRALTDADVPDALTIVGGTLNNTPIGNVTPSSVVGTTIQANTAFLVGSGGPRLNSSAGIVQVRNNADTADADLKANTLQLSGGNPAAGRVLTSSNAGGSAVWQSLDLGSGIAQGRLTLVSDTPVPIADIATTAAQTLYYTPYQGNRIALFNGSIWVPYVLTQRSLSLSALVANTNYDIFIYDNAGTLTLEALAWTNNTTRATALIALDGILTKSGQSTRRYLGTIRTVAAGQSEDSAKRRFVFNYNNQVARRLANLASANNWTYNTSTFRPANNDTSLRVEIVTGAVNMTQSSLSLTLQCLIGLVGTSDAQVAIGENSTTAASGSSFGVYAGGVTSAGGTMYLSSTSTLNQTPANGYSFYQWIEKAKPAGATFYGLSYDNYQSGLSGWTLG